jgi:hypothetical protein
MGTRIRSALVACPLLGAVLVGSACASSEETNRFDDDGGASSSGGSSGLGGTNDGGGISSEILDSCATDTARANPLPLDLYILFDSSGSMLYEAAPGVTKMKATTDAFRAFINDPSSAGLGAALTFFPAHPPGAAFTCTSSAQCGTAGICTVKKCDTNTEVRFCDDDQDCPVGDCINAGVCEKDPTAYCNLSASECLGAQGTVCQNQPAFVCAPRDSCLQANYETPVVPFGTLPANAVAINTAIASKKPFGGTPTAPALAAAEIKAHEYALNNAGHTVAIVLVTDGLPSTALCTSVDNTIDSVAALAKVGADAKPKIRTFVIGVFSAAEQADPAKNPQANLDKIAAAGDTGKAFIVGVNANTTKDLVAAMNQVRGKALPCEYNVPQPAGGIPDYGKVNVRHTAPSGAKVVYPNVANAAACGTGGGWYFDTPPSAGAPPAKIILCPATCTEANTAGGQVDVVLGCQTVVR